MVTNLVNNAIKFTDRGSVVVDGAATPCEGNRYDVHLAVTDTGTGIAPEAQGKLFQAFYQVRDGRAADRMGGTGLGLAICKGICDVMGGTIDVQSEIGRGTTFTARFQAEGVEDVSAIVPERPAQIETDLGTRFPLRILLVEDNPTNQLVTVQFLAKLGYGTDVAANGQEALEMVVRHPYDLIFMDCRMPIMDGFEAARRIRQSLPSTRWPAIVALTASAFEDDRAKCLAAGMDDVLAKPVELDVLQRALAKWGCVGGLEGAAPDVVDRPPTGASAGGPVDVAVLLQGFAGMERTLVSGVGSFLSDTSDLLRDIQMRWKHAIVSGCAMPRMRWPARRPCSGLPPSSACVVTLNGWDKKAAWIAQETAISRLRLRWNGHASSWPSSRCTVKPSRAKIPSDCNFLHRPFRRTSP